MKLKEEKIKTLKIKKENQEKCRREPAKLYQKTMRFKEQMK